MKATEEFIKYKLKLAELHAQEKTRKSFIRITLGLFLGSIVLYMVHFLLLREIPQGNREVVIALVNLLVGAFAGSVVSYYFGDSDSRIEIPDFDFSKNENEENDF